MLFKIDICLEKIACVSFNGKIVNMSDCKLPDFNSVVVSGLLQRVLKRYRALQSITESYRHYRADFGPN